MRILVVDDQAETAGALAQGLREVTPHEVLSAVGGQEALDVSRRVGAPDVLITEIVLADLDGFQLNESLREMQPELKTIIVTGYDLSEYAEYLDGTPIFYKPADPAAVAAALDGEGPPAAEAVPASTNGAVVPPSNPASKSASLTDELPTDKRSQSSKLRHLVGKQGFTGKLDQFDLVDIIQMCCVSKKTGCLQIARRTERGVLYLRGGQIIHAVTGPLQGEEAAYQIVGWSNGQFSFGDGIQPETQTIQSGWEHLVMEGVRRRDEQAGDEQREAAPDAVDPGLPGKSIGPYELRRKIGQSDHSQVFEAVQTSMDRVVALKVPLPEFQQDEAAVQTFLAQASAKANVQHPSILAVYEAGYNEGLYYYTREYVDGLNLTALHAQGRTMDDATALQCIKIVTEALSYLNQQKIPHPPLTADDVYLGRDNRPRLNNVASLPGEQNPPTQQDIRALSRMVTDCLPGHAASTPGLRSLLGRMLLDSSAGYLSWGALLQAVKALEPKVVPEDAFKLSAQDAAAIAAVDDARRRQRRAVLLTTIGMFGLFWLVVLVGYFKFFRQSAPRIFDRLIQIPAGDFLFGTGDKTVNLPVYWIDEYEVTIGQYAQFLEALRLHPTKAYEAPNVPPGHSHENIQWNNLYDVAQGAGRYNGAPVDLNCPAVFVDWFDAYAYAKWKGHRLPTEQEWEKAARGTDGRRFPWGNDARKISQVNTSADFHAEDGAIKGEVDGYNRWSPVDAMAGDKSPYGVMDMAGNVSEWTATLTHRGSLTYPMICGGNYGSSDVELTRRSQDLPDIKGFDRVGFRTVSDTPPTARQITRFPPLPSMFFILLARPSVRRRAARGLLIAVACMVWIIGLHDAQAQLQIDLTFNRHSYILYEPVLATRDDHQQRGPRHRAGGYSRQTVVEHGGHDARWRDHPAL